MTASATPNASPTTTLTPSYKLPIAIILLSLPLLFLQLAIGLFLSALGLFLLYQTTTIRLAFTPTDLEVRRGDSLLKVFPYSIWQNWTIFWPPVPILFYFKEVNSIHFLPILFNPQELNDNLMKYCDQYCNTGTGSYQAKDK